AGSCGFTKKVLSWQRELSSLWSATSLTGETLHDSSEETRKIFVLNQTYRPIFVVNFQMIFFALNLKNILLAPKTLSPSLSGFHMILFALKSKSESSLQTS
ncbi:hypothetical protein, partial [Flavobacterium caeni]|uniref:hypothetical protein n=1 Tax=Flavobacterium caeni TaxID=490189 RepID=UPI001B8AFEA6